MFQKTAYCILFLVLNNTCFSQSKLNQFLKPSDTLNVSKQNTLVISEASFVGLSLIGLNSLWYNDYDRSRFHTINDGNEWKQMDKIGHAFSAYNLGRVGAELLNWSGVSKKNQLIYGATLGFAFLTTVEVFDGFSEEWGFSWSDIGANAIGTGLYVGQDLLWDEQRIVLKYSFHRSNYASQRPNTLGNGLLEEAMKDYNGQTYWLSANLNSFFKESKLPKWLNLAFGYGADGMFTGNNETVDNMFTNQNQIRQYYLSFDVDLTRIKTKSHVLKSIFSVLNVIKVPLPTIEFNSQNRLVFRLFYF
ncbi:MAG: DUF2279 domain-containing protein [Bacteroidetes bacterium]|nr:MAG: DUF2279 domain-containing protein [Bacteroidota bacterium]